MMRGASKKFLDMKVPEELGVYLLHFMDALANEALKAVMGGNGLALGLGSNKTMQDEGACGSTLS